MSAERAEQVLHALRSLPRVERLRIVERVVHDIAEEDAFVAASPFVGMFADDPELMDAVCEGAMQAREGDPLRVGDR